MLFLFLLSVFLSSDDSIISDTEIFNDDSMISDFKISNDDESDTEGPIENKYPTNNIRFKKHEYQQHEYQKIH